MPYLLQRFNFIFKKPTEEQKKIYLRFEELRRDLERTRLQYSRFIK